MKNLKNSSQLVQDDSLTSTTYSRNNFKPSSEVEKFTYTSHRVTKAVYNSYEKKKDDYLVFGYFTDWSQYDGRLDNPQAVNEDCGRGVDATRIPAGAYDKITLGFLGVVGDQGEKKQTIDNAATCGNWPNSPTDTAGYCRSQYQVTFTDPWGDVLSYRNCGFPGWLTNDVESMYNEESAHGILGALSKLKKQNPDLRIGVSIGGWTMSNIFYELSRNAEARKIFIDSIIEILDKFPMISDLDLDWEYPGMAGNTGNQFADDDYIYFAQLVSELKSKLMESGYGSIKISIATNAGIEGLGKANVPAMLAAGVDGINLMTYDYFGTPWAPALAHHSNLHDYGSASLYSIEKAVKFLQNQQVDLSKVYIGYAAYSRSAKNADLSSLSPLQGSYSPGTTTTTGSFESGACEWYDIIYNYLDLEGKTGRNGFILYTDEQADADYLYNPESKLFISFDTPRTVKSKGEFVRKYGLGGLFTWTIDMDNGLLVNAAREGLNATLQNQVVDMSSFYFKGVNSGDVPDSITPRITGQTGVNPGDTIHLSGEDSTGAVTWHWHAPGLAFDNSNDAVVEAVADKMGDFPVTLAITGSAGQRAETSVIVRVTNKKPVARITGKTQVNNGDIISLSGEDSVNVRGYLWSAPGLPFDGSSESVVQAIANINGRFPVTLTVASPEGEMATTSITLVIEDEVIPQWQAKAYPTPHTKVRNNFNNQGEHIYANNWYAEAYNEPGNPDFTGPEGSGRVWTVIE